MPACRSRRRHQRREDRAKRRRHRERHDRSAVTAHSGSTDRIAPLVGSLLDEIGEAATRAALIHTPARVAASLRFLLSGYALNVDDVVHGAIFEEPYSEMVVVKDIEVYSLCEHHLLPFFGKAHVAYIPD